VLYNESSKKIEEERSSSSSVFEIIMQKNLGWAVQKSNWSAFLLYPLKKKKNEIERE